MKVLALDASTTSTGLALFEDGQLVDYKLLPATGSDPMARIKKICKQLKDYMEDKYIDTIVLEEVRGGDTAKNMHVQKVLMYLQAAIAFTIYDNFPTKMEFLYPSEWRAVCHIKQGRGVKRTELKKEDIDFINKKFNLSLKSDDIADAIGIGYAYIMKNKLTSYEDE